MAKSPLSITVCVSGLCMALWGCSPHAINLDPQPVVQSNEYSNQLPSVPDSPTLDSLTHTPDPASIVRSESESAQPWWLSFNDPVLNALIKSALDSNITIEQGLARLAQAESLLAQARGVRFPELALDGAARKSWDRDRVSDHQTTIGPSVFWDPDLFARLESSELARLYEFEASTFALEDLKLELTFQVVQTYFLALEQHLQLLLLKEQVKIDSDLLDLVERSFDAGVVSRVDYLQQKGQLADTESLIPLAEISLRTFENRLSVLLAETPQLRSPISYYHSNFPDIPPQAAAGVPADLLVTRPDLAASKALLLAADAEIGRAIAERLPQIKLTGSYLYSTGTDPSGFISDVFGSLFQPLIDWGVRRAEVDRSKAFYQERLFEFSQIYLLAIEEVENSLFQIDKQAEFIAKLEVRDQILRETLEEAKRRYSAGVTDYLPVLDTLQELRQIERNLVTEKRNLMLYHATLHRALGGSIGG